MKTITVSALAACCLILAACGGEAALGEECGEAGVDGECEDGAVCGKSDDSGDLICLEVCTDQDDCAADEECNGVDGSNLKGCRTK
jgi:hypothetical protein